MKNVNFQSRNSIFWLFAGFLFLALCIAYSNHFSNGFQFDDSHTISNNTYIRDIKNIPLFFTDIKYYGTNPGNQGYNPVLVSLNAIDYWLAGDLNPVAFHADIFITYILMLVLLFFLCRKISDLSLKSEHNRLIALLLVGFYGIHAANAETINYIIMRSDSFSTLCIIASILLYINPKTRKYYLYLFAIVISILTKETGVMAGPILFVYILFFEEDVSLLDLVTFKKLKKVFITLKKSVPALLFSFGTYYLITKIFIPADKELIGNTSSVFQYFYTQWVVIAHYIGNFILPLKLSADSDFELYGSIINRDVLLALLLILSLLIAAIVSSRKRENRPIAFGILWFFIALAPTSSFIVLAQISNDHRTFFPYIGLVISFGWWMRILFLRNEETFLKYKFLSGFFVAVYMFVITFHAYGTYQRNIVWSSSETLWYDASVKSPKNGRAQMNYGLTLMAEGKYDETLTYFKRALELMPYWAYIHINMAILREAMGASDEAEQYFKNAIRYQSYVPDGYYFYARWLHAKNRIDEAIAQLEKGKEISPGHIKISEYLGSLQSQKGETKEERIRKMEKNAAENPTIGNYVDLSLLYYRSSMFNECIEACRKAIQIDPESGVAYNNMCSAYNELGQWENAVAAGKKAVEIDSTFQRARNNLKWALKNLKK